MRLRSIREWLSEPMVKSGSVSNANQLIQENDQLIHSNASIAPRRTQKPKTDNWTFLVGHWTFALLLKKPIECYNELIDPRPNRR